MKKDLYFVLSAFSLLALCISCNISEDKVKTVIILDELSKPKSKITENQIIQSSSLKYELYYQVYTPANYDQLEKMPSVYLLDGPWFKEEGNLPRLLDRLIDQKKIKPLIAVFVDSRNPRNPKINRRNDEFLGNEAYIRFLRDELIPKIDSSYKTSTSPDDRALIGISFGAVAAAFGGIKAPDSFHLIGCLSPATHPFPEIYDAYQNNEKLPLKFFLSTGTKNDKLEETQRLRAILKEKSYDYIYRESSEGHTWKNWKPMSDDWLIYFFEPK